MSKVCHVNRPQIYICKQIDVSGIFRRACKMVLNYSRIALEFYRTALKNYSENALELLLNVYGAVVEPYMEHYLFYNCSSEGLKDSF